MSAKAVVFDLDGTLVDSPGAITEITGAILREMGFERSDADIRATVGKPLDRNLANLMRLEAGHPEIARAMALYRERFGLHVRERGEKLLYPGVREGLGKLREHGLLIALATSKTLDGAQKTVRATNIADRFDTLVGDDMVEEGKPGPAMALYAADMLETKPERCTVVGDTAGDVLMGRRAGMEAIGVTYGVGTPDELVSAGAGRCADSFDDVVALLLEQP
ncbi:HAD family hydrolase [Nocardiopsis dassonvillei]|uniref:HAD family hydrolase n=1 Tax=Nocardiopsis dassonvillei TaxID=2014 RepID=UPI0036725D70